LKLGEIYKVFDKIERREYNIIIQEINVDEISFRILNTWEGAYRAIEDLEILDLIENSKILENKYKNNIISFKSNLIKGIISREELISICNKNEGLKDFGIEDNEISLISITDPKSKKIDDTIYSNFKNVLVCNFWDIEENFGNYKVISDKQAKKIFKFINKNINDSFLIHCEAGVSRSAAIALAIEYIYENGDIDILKSGIFKHYRYSPNKFVFDKITQF